MQRAKIDIVNMETFSTCVFLKKKSCKEKLGCSIVSTSSPKIRFLDFAGYYLERDISTIPKGSGVYCVYACTYNPSAVTSGTISIRSLIYIGEAEDVNDHLANTENWKDWRKHLREGEELCFNMAPVEPSERLLVSAALIFHQKPPENSEFKDSFPFENVTVVNTSGRNYLLRSQCVVTKTLPEPSEAHTSDQPVTETTEKAEGERKTNAEHAPIDGGKMQATEAGTSYGQ
jgi:hypothetical protein